MCRSLGFIEPTAKRLSTLPQEGLDTPTWFLEAHGAPVLRLHVGELKDLTRRGLGHRSLQPHPEEPLALGISVPGQVSAAPEKETQFLGLTVRRQGLEEHQDQLVPSFI